jgi:hypothetical protein
MSDIYDGAEWTEMDIEDLKSAIEHSRSIEEIAEFLRRPTTLRVNAPSWTRTRPSIAPLRL